MSVKCTKMKSKARAHSVCHCSIYSLVVAVLARFLPLSMSERDRFQRSGTWPSCLSKISRSNMRFTVELKQSALSTPVNYFIEEISMLGLPCKNSKFHPAA